MSQIFWPNYLFHADFSADQAELAAVPLGPVSEETATLLAASLSSHDTGEGREHWTDKPGAEWSLLDVEVVFNGGNQVGLPTKYVHNHALGLKFPETSNNPAPGSVLFVQYDVPDAPPTIPDVPEVPTDVDTSDSTPEPDADAQPAAESDAS